MIQQVSQFAPDAIIVYFNLPGLSDKNLLVTLVSIGVNVLVIVLSEQDTKEDVIQTFRLGAFDYLIWPMREAEVVTVVDRFLNQMRTRREREHLTRQLKESSNEHQQRLWVEPQSQISCNGQTGQLGRRAWQISRPKRIKLR